MGFFFSHSFRKPINYLDVIFPYAFEKFGRKARNLDSACSGRPPNTREWFRSETCSRKRRIERRKVRVQYAVVTSHDIPHLSAICLLLIPMRVLKTFPCCPSRGDDTSRFTSQPDNKQPVAYLNILSLPGAPPHLKRFSVCCDLDFLGELFSLRIRPQFRVPGQKVGRHVTTQN
jgi:hypothetical protein